MDEATVKLLAQLLVTQQIQMDLLVALLIQKKPERTISFDDFRQLCEMDFEKRGASLVREFEEALQSGKLLDLLRTHNRVPSWFEHKSGQA